MAMTTGAGRLLHAYLTGQVSVTPVPEEDADAKWAAVIEDIEREAAKAERDALRWAISNGPFVTPRGDARKGGAPYIEVMRVFNERDDERTVTNGPVR